MYRYHLLFFHLWLISATEKGAKKTNLNHNPLILSDKVGNCHYPKKAYITDEQTQEYYHSKEHDGRYYCPLEDNEENDDLIQDIKHFKILEYQYCLFEKSFKKGEEKMCQGEVNPLIVEKRDKFGHAKCGHGYLYKFAYEICVKKSSLNTIWRYLRGKKRPKRDLFSEVSHPHLYEICYNHSDDGDNARAVLFTEHKIRSPYILRNLILKEERAMHDLSKGYSTESYGHKNLVNLGKTLKAYELEDKIGRKRFIPQMLVPMYDFALGHWMRTTLHIINHSPQDIMLEYLWRAINMHVYSTLIKLYEKLGDVRIFTGTWGVLKDGNEEEVYVGNYKDARVTIPLMWWKLLYAPDVKQAVIIIMHNTPPLQKICNEEKNACDLSKWGLSFELQGWHNDYVYCCKMSSAERKIDTMRHLKVDILNDILELD